MIKSLRRLFTKLQKLKLGKTRESLLDIEKTLGIYSQLKTLEEIDENFLNKLAELRVMREDVRDVIYVLSSFMESVIGNEYGIPFVKIMNYLNYLRQYFQIIPSIKSRIKSVKKYIDNFPYFRLIYSIFEPISGACLTVTETELLHRLCILLIRINKTFKTPFTFLLDIRNYVPFRVRTKTILTPDVYFPGPRLYVNIEKCLTCSESVEAYEIIDESEKIKYTKICYALVIDGECFSLDALKEINPTDVKTEFIFVIKRVGKESMNFRYTIGFTYNLEKLITDFNIWRSFGINV